MRAEIAAAGLPCEYRLTAGMGHATDLTRNALQEGFETVVAVGGDGTLNEVVNGFFADDKLVNPNARLGVISYGTGGDFVKAAGIPREFAAEVKVLANGRTRRIDVGKIVFQGHNGNNTRYYINVAGLGLDAEAIDRVNHTSKALGGFLSFLWGTVNTLLRYRNRWVSIEVDGRLCYEGKATMVAVANGQYIGAGMKIAPHASLDNGLFDVVIIDGMSKMRMLKKLPGLYKGEHINLPEVKVVQGKQVRAFSRDRVLIEVEGEQPGCLDAEFTILNAALDLIC